MQQKNTIIDILTMEKGSFPWWPSWVFFVELSPFIYIYEVVKPFILNRIMNYNHSQPWKYSFIGYENGC
jgi:hypothetical protein